MSSPNDLFPWLSCAFLVSLASCWCLEYVYSHCLGGIRINFVYIGTLCITGAVLWPTLRGLPLRKVVVDFHIVLPYLWYLHLNWQTLWINIFPNHLSAHVPFISQLLDKMLCYVSGYFKPMTEDACIFHTTWCDDIGVVMTEIAHNVCHNFFGLAILYHWDICYIPGSYTFPYILRIATIFPGQGTCNSQSNNQRWVAPKYRH